MVLNQISKEYFMPKHHVLSIPMDHQSLDTKILLVKDIIKSFWFKIYLWMAGMVLRSQFNKNIYIW